MPTLEQRIGALEEKVAQLTANGCGSTASGAWWDDWCGAFERDDTFAEAVRLGAEFRASQPNAADSPDALKP
jgi:hypothetical protein